MNAFFIPQLALAITLIKVKDSRDLIEGVSKLDEMLIVSIFQKPTYPEVVNDMLDTSSDRIS
jgi:hypothetical protein